MRILDCVQAASDRVPTPEEIADYEAWERQMRDCYLNRISGTHSAPDPEGDGCPHCGYGAK